MKLLLLLVIGSLSKIENSPCRFHFNAEYSHKNAFFIFIIDYKDSSKDSINSIFYGLLIDDAIKRKKRIENFQVDSISPVSDRNIKAIFSEKKLQYLPFFPTNYRQFVRSNPDCININKEQLSLFYLCGDTFYSKQMDKTFEVFNMPYGKYIYVSMVNVSGFSIELSKFEYLNILNATSAKSVLGDYILSNQLGKYVRVWHNNKNKKNQTFLTYSVK